MAENSSAAKWIPAVVLAWVVPGGGHLFLKRPGRGGLIAASVAGMFLLGLMMQGALFSPMRGDLLTMLIYTGGFVGNLMSGVLYFITVALGYAQEDMAGHVHDYGTKFLVGAGLLNVLGMVDAFEIATGGKISVPKVNLSHFEASLLFALLTSVVLGIITKRTDRERVRYAVYCFGCFLAAIFGLSWLMYLGHG